MLREVGKAIAWYVIAYVWLSCGAFMDKEGKHRSYWWTEVLRRQSHTEHSMTLSDSLELWLSKIVVRPVQGPILDYHNPLNNHPLPTSVWANILITVRQIWNDKQTPSFHQLKYQDIRGLPQPTYVARSTLLYNLVLPATYVKCLPWSITSFCCFY